MTEFNRLRTAADFWQKIVVPDCNDYSAKPSDLRLALHTAISLFHLHDWVFVSHESQVRNQFNFRDKNNSVQPVSDAKTFANSLEQAHGDFGLIRSVANAAKHLGLSDRRPVLGAANNAANTYSTSTGGGAARVVLEGPNGDLEFMDIAQSVFKMWEKLDHLHGWW